jgi:arsenate reductase (thioredoxin)
MQTVIFACVRNAGRSQMAAALFNVLADARVATAVSAGTQPAERVHPVVVEVMSELGLDLRPARPQRLTRDMASNAVLLVTMGCGDECPVVPGLAREDWALPDPGDQPVEKVRAIRDEIQERVRVLVTTRGWARQTFSPGGPI